MTTCSHCQDEVDERYEHTCTACGGRVHRGCCGVCPNTVPITLADVRRMPGTMHSPEPAEDEED